MYHPTVIAACPPPGFGPKSDHDIAQQFTVVFPGKAPPARFAQDQRSGSTQGLGRPTRTRGDRLDGRNQMGEV